MVTPQQILKEVEARYFNRATALQNLGQLCIAAVNIAARRVTREAVGQGFDHAARNSIIGEPFYVLPDNVFYVTDCIFNTHLLEVRPAPDIYAYNQSVTSNDVPRFWALDNDSERHLLLLCPRPSEVKKIHIWYRAYPAEITGINSYPRLPIEYDEVIRLLSMAEIAGAVENQADRQRFLLEAQMQMNEANSKRHNRGRRMVARERRAYGEDSLITGS